MTPKTKVSWMHEDKRGACKVLSRRTGTLQRVEGSQAVILNDHSGKTCRIAVERLSEVKH